MCVCVFVSRKALCMYVHEACLFLFVVVASSSCSPSAEPLPTSYKRGRREGTERGESVPKPNTIKPKFACIIYIHTR